MGFFFNISYYVIVSIQKRDNRGFKRAVAVKSTIGNYNNIHIRYRRLFSRVGSSNNHYTPLVGPAAGLY